MDRATGPPAEAIVVLPPGPRPQSPPYPADHRAATGTEPGGRDQGRTGPPAARPRPSRAGRVVRGRVSPRPAGPSAGGRPVLSRSSRTSCPPQTTRTSPGPWSWTALPCRAGTGSTSRARTRAGTTGPDLRVACTPAGRPVRVPAPAPGSAHDARALQRTGLLDNSPDTPPLGDEGCIGPGMTTPLRRPAGANPWTGRNSTPRSSVHHGPRSNEQQPD